MFKPVPALKLPSGAHSRQGGRDGHSPAPKDAPARASQGQLGQPSVLTFAQKSPSPSPRVDMSDCEIASFVAFQNHALGSTNENVRTPRATERLMMHLAEGLAEMETQVESGNSHPVIMLTKTQTGRLARLYTVGDRYLDSAQRKLRPVDRSKADLTRCSAENPAVWTRTHSRPRTRADKWQLAWGCTCTRNRTMAFTSPLSPRAAQVTLSVPLKILPEAAVLT